MKCASCKQPYVRCAECSLPLNDPHCSICGADEQKSFPTTEVIPSSPNLKGGSNMLSKLIDSREEISEAILEINQTLSELQDALEELESAHEQLDSLIDTLENVHGLSVSVDVSAISVDISVDL